MTQLMNPEIKDQWIDALTNGTYRQGTGVLQTGDGSFCCLGVLCDLYHQETGNGEWVAGSKQVANVNAERVPVTNPTTGFTDMRFPDKTIHFKSFLGDHMREAREITRWSGLDYMRASKLAELNDNGRSFAEIAEVIQADF